MAGLNLGVIPLSDRDSDYFRVMVNAHGWTARTVMSKLVKDFVQENKEEFDAAVTYASRKYGLTFDEVFHRLLEKKSLGEPLSNFSVDPEMEEKLNGLAKK
ncbi:MAG: hypothetical protein ACFCBU_00150 [Cyanophyceae cyanobacterium]